MPSNLRNQTLKDRWLTGTGLLMIKTNKNDIFTCPNLFLQSVNLLLSHLHRHLQPVALWRAHGHFALRQPRCVLRWRLLETEWPGPLLQSGGACAFWASWSVIGKSERCP